MSGWNHWYHVTNSTYGTWLRGDPRGWRARQHREHVEGDYKSPPPAGLYERLHVRSKTLLTKPPVLLTWNQRVVVCKAFIEALQFHAISVQEFAVGEKHIHLLAQFPRDRVTQKGVPIPDPVRHFTGIAKKESARRLSAAGLVSGGGIWAEKSHPIPIVDKRHWDHVRTYIRKHAQEGAVVWSSPTATEDDRIT
ncbi:MAG TPA: hypothetical protein VG711_05410 [Phycisphaerales bacterium]|nr:hypothetical protein [Phycisphaerales bacterium]